MRKLELAVWHMQRRQVHEGWIASAVISAGRLTV